MDRESYTVPKTADYINQHFVAVKVDYDTATKLVAQLQRAQALLNLPAGLPLTSFLTPDGELYSGAGYLPPARTILSPSSIPKDRFGGRITGSSGVYGE